MPSAVNIAVQTLLGISGVTDIVGQRIDPFPVRQTTALPAIGVQLIAQPDGFKLDGPIGYPTARVSLHCIAETATGADTLAEAVAAGINGYTGTVLSVGVAVFKTGGDYSDYTEDLATFRRVSDYIFRWR